ncbi:MAG: pilus assembly protein [Vallitalea sp.]|jgi:hypothetical protein|nr:pilus assembly protein [Vallitalea sp.]
MNKRLIGSLTVEASLIFPIVLFVVISLLYIGIYLHDVTCMKAIVNEATQRYELAYSNKIDINTGEVLSNNKRLSRGLYWRFSNYNDHDKYVKEFIRNKIKDNLIMKDDNIIISTKIIHNNIMKSVNITVEKDFTTFIAPVNNILSLNGKNLTMAVSSKAIVKDQVELIRNIDMLDNISDDIPILRNSKENYKKKIRDIIDFFQ